jgi:type IX secretion system PorP/SprF family membrane protein
MKIQMKNLLILLIIVPKLINAQDIKINRQYLTTPGLVNPAFTGQDLCLEVNFINSFQWLGIPNSPRTHLIDFQTGINSNKYNNYSRHGLGTTIYTDVNGPFSFSGIRAAYAFHSFINKKKDAKINLGISVTGTWFTLNQSKLFQNPNVIPNDPALNYSVNNSVVPNMAIGGLITIKKMYAGLSAMNLLPIYPSYERVIIGKRSYNLIMGYQYFSKVTSLYLEPLMLFSIANNGMRTIDISIKSVFYQAIGFTLSYRHNLTTIPGIGSGLAARISLLRNHWTYAYMFDFGFNGLQSNSLGNHEIVIGYRLCHKQKDKCPAY